MPSPLRVEQRVEQDTPRNAHVERVDRVVRVAWLGWALGSSQDQGSGSGSGTGSGVRVRVKGEAWDQGWS